MKSSRMNDIIQLYNKKEGVEMRAGVIGCGGMGTTHLRALKALQEIRGIEVEAVADIRKECVEKPLEYGQRHTPMRLVWS